MLLLKIVTHEELQGPAYNFVRISGKRGCPLIRACSVGYGNYLTISLHGLPKAYCLGDEFTFFKVTSCCVYSLMRVDLGCDYLHTPCACIYIYIYIYIYMY